MQECLNKVVDVIIDMGKGEIYPQQISSDDLPSFMEWGLEWRD